MKHKAFEAWILSERVLDPEERVALYDHLIECSECDRLAKSLRSAAQLLETAPEIAPAPGFSGRWLARLDRHSRARRTRQNLLMLLSTSLAAWLFLWLSGLQFFSGLDRMIGITLDRMDAAAGLAGRMGAALAHQQPDLTFNPTVLLPALLVMTAFAVIGAAFVIWMMMFRRFARSVGLVQWA